MKRTNWTTLAVVGAGGAGLWWMTLKPRWNVGDIPGPGVTIVQVEKTLLGYRYYVEFAETPGVIYGPLTEAEVLAQFPGILEMRASG